MTTLAIQHISAGYRDHAVLRDVSLTVHPGDVVGLIGPNGAGKSTLLRVVAGTLRAGAGWVRLDGVEIGSLSAADRARRIAVVPQRAQAPPAFTAAEVVLMGRTAYLPRFRGERPRD